MKHENIDVLFEHNAVGLFGENGVEGVHLVKRMGESDEERYDLAIDGFFLAIGHQPNSDIFKPYLDTDETGYIITEGDSPRTKVPGVFAAGDIADQRVGNVDQPLRESAGIHQTAADDKERQREQREGIYAGIHVLGEILHGGKWL